MDYITDNMDFIVELVKSGFIGVSMVMDSLQDGGVIAIDRNNPVWLIMDVIKVLACVLIFAIAGFAMRSKRIKENDMYDMEISGKIIGYDTLTGRTKLPGYAQPTVEYIDPYSGEPDSYMVNQDINRKKHPIGSEYKLLYSREKRTAYEKKSNKVYREMEVCFGGLAVLIFWLVFHTCGSFFNKRRGGHAI